MRPYIIPRENATVSTYSSAGILRKLKRYQSCPACEEGQIFDTHTSSRGPCPPLTTRRPRASLMPPAPLSRHSPLLSPFVHLLSWRLHYWSNHPLFERCKRSENNLTTWWNSFEVYVNRTSLNECNATFVHNWVKFLSAPHRIPPNYWSTARKQQKLLWPKRLSWTHLKRTSSLTVFHFWPTQGLPHPPSHPSVGANSGLTLATRIKASSALWLATFTSESQPIMGWLVRKWVDRGELTDVEGGGGYCGQAREDRWRGGWRCAFLNLIWDRMERCLNKGASGQPRAAGSRSVWTGAPGST